MLSVLHVNRRHVAPMSNPRFVISHGYALIPPPSACCGAPWRASRPSDRRDGSRRRRARFLGLLCGFARQLAAAKRAAPRRIMKRREGRFLRGWFGSTLPARRHAANRQELARWRVCRRRKERSVIRPVLRRLWGAPVWNWGDAFHLFFLFETPHWGGL
jgi:hypothetical protein